MKKKRTTMTIGRKKCKVYMAVKKHYCKMESMKIEENEIIVKFPNM